MLLFVTVVGASVWALFHILPFYYYSFELQGAFDAQATKAAVLSDQQIRKTLLKTIKEMNIPVDNEDDLKINRFEGKIVIDLQYQEVLYFEYGDWSQDIYVFDFHPRAERSF